MRRRRDMSIYGSNRGDAMRYWLGYLVPRERRWPPSVSAIQRASRPSSSISTHLPCKIFNRRYSTYPKSPLHSKKVSFSPYRSSHAPDCPFFPSQIGISSTNADPRTRAVALEFGSPSWRADHRESEGARPLEDEPTRSNTSVSTAGARTPNRCSAEHRPSQRTDECGRARAQSTPSISRLSRVAANVL